MSITPVTPSGPNSVDSSRDEAKAGYSLAALERLVADCADQPTWRERADIAAAYVDGKQLTPLQQQALIAEGMPEVKPTNLIGRVIRSILGSEAKARTDVKVESDDDDIADVAEVMNQNMAEAKRETRADSAVSNAYAGLVGPGIGWVEVARSQDPLDYPYRVVDVHRSEMWWDWRDSDNLLRKARWQVRKRWQDLDELEAAMPQFAWLFKVMANGWNGFVFDDTVDETSAAQWRSDGERWRNYQRRTEWFDSARKRVKLYEVWYKVPAMAVVMHLSPTRRVLFDETNQTHLQAVASGKVKVSKQLTRQVRMALFAGPHRIQDIGTTRRSFPYIPFFGYRDDEDLTPYGLVEGMISPQDEYNARRLRVNWLLRARQILVDNDALDEQANTLPEIAARIMRPDLNVVLNANRKNVNGFVVSQNLSLEKEQIEVMQDAKQLIQDVPGVYGSQLGQAQSGVTSGIANSLLIEQGAVAMGDLNDGYRDARRAVFEGLLELIVEDHLTANMQVKIGRGQARRVVVLNSFDDQGNLINQVKDAPMRVGLGEAPSTPAFRMQQQQVVGQIITALAQAGSAQGVALMAPMFIEASDLPNRQEAADDLRRVSGIPTAGDKAAQQQAQAKAAQDAAQKEAMMAQAAQLALQEQAGKVRKLASETDKLESEVGLNNAKAVEIGHSMGVQSIQTAQAGQAAQAANDTQIDPEAERQRQIDQAMAEAMQAA
jgi:hypothetical protein